MGGRSKHLDPEPDSPVAAALRRHPGFLDAVAADTRFIAPRCGRPMGPSPSKWAMMVETLRIAWESDAYLAQIAFRLRADLLRRRVPILPKILHRFSIVWIQMSISDSVVIKPGVSIPHGLVTIGGLVEIGAGVMISPSVSIGLTTEGGYRGPTIGPGTQIGTGSRILGAVEIGRRVRVGANSVVLTDLADDVTAVGAPARVVNRLPKPSPSGVDAEAR
jgi:serine O-acetyltransferase